jgi:diguanylate cyclase (GGDEF)-like protein
MTTAELADDPDMATTALRSGDRAFDRERVALALVTVAAIGVYLVIERQVGGASFSLHFSNGVQIVAPLLAALACWRTSLRCFDRERWAWRLIALSTASWASGQMIWTWFESVQGNAVPFPSLADVGYLLAVPLAVAGVLSFPHQPGRWTSKVRIVLDAMIVAVALLRVSWTLVLRDLTSEPLESELQRVLSLAYPLADVVLMSILVIAFAGAQSRYRRTLSYVASGFALFAVADTSFLISVAQGASVTALADTTWTAGYLLIAVGALFAPLWLPMVEQTDAPPTPRMLLAPYLLAGLALLFALANTVVVNQFEIIPSELAMTTVLVGLIIVRQSVTLLDNAKLTRTLAEINARLEHMALHDSLTGLPNRVLFLDRLEVALANARRTGLLVAVMFIDLDDFKPINDHYGHETGDLVLRSLARTLEHSVRAGDTVARFGGDEFLVACDHLDSVTSAIAIAERLLMMVQTPVTIGDELVSVRASIGVVLASPSDSAESLVHRADEAMYAAKADKSAPIRVEVPDCWAIA